MPNIAERLDQELGAHLVLQIEVEKAGLAFQETPRPGEAEARKLRGKQSVAGSDPGSEPLALDAFDDRLCIPAHLHISEAERVRHLLGA